MISTVRAMMHGMTDIMMLKFSYIIINLKNHTNVHVEIFSSNHYKSTCGVAKDFTPTRLEKQMGESQLSNTTILINIQLDHIL